MYISLPSYGPDTMSRIDSIQEPLDEARPIWRVSGWFPPITASSGGSSMPFDWRSTSKSRTFFAVKEGAAFPRKPLCERSSAALTMQPTGMRYAIAAGSFAEIVD